MIIKLIKFNTGEEVVANVMKDTDSEITFKNGLTMVFNGQGMQAIPFSMNSEEGVEITILKDRIQFISEPRADLKTQYQQQFSSLIVPPKELIKG